MKKVSIFLDCLNRPVRDPVNEQRLVEYRTAKQSLSSTLKSFGVPDSADVNSVVSYAQSVEEHDRKGNRPRAEGYGDFPGKSSIT